MKIAGPPHYDQATEREAMLDGIRWILDLVTTKGSLRTKLLALRYLLRMEGQSLKQLGAPFGTSKQAIDRWIKIYSEVFTMPRIREAARSSYSARAKRTWARKQESSTP